MTSNLIIGGLVAIVIAIGAIVYIQHTPNKLGGVSNVDTLSATGLQVGTNCNSSGSTCGGTTISQLLSGTCNAISYSSLSASSTLRVDCAVTGVVSGDKVFVSLPVSNKAGALNVGANGIVLAGGAAASSTSGYISFDLFNASGAATSSYPQASTSVQYWVVR